MLTTYIRAMGRKQQLMFSMPFQAELRMCTFKADTTFPPVVDSHTQLLPLPQYFPCYYNKKIS